MIRRIHLFEDCYTGQLGSPAAAPRQLVAHGLAAMPFWVGVAMRLRNLVVAPFGLKTGAQSGGGDGLLSRLPVLEETTTTFETGLDDRHLDFRVRLAKEPDGTFALTTHVKTHNLFGRLYLTLVLPVHRLIMRRIASGLAQPIKEDL